MSRCRPGARSRRGRFVALADGSTAAARCPWMDLEVSTLVGATILVPIVAAFEPDYQARYQAKEPDSETDFGPIPVREIHRCCQADKADQQIEIRQTFVDWLRDPHGACFPLPPMARENCPSPRPVSPVRLERTSSWRCCCLRPARRGLRGAGTVPWAVCPRQRGQERRSDRVRTTRMSSDSDKPSTARSVSTSRDSSRNPCTKRADTASMSSSVIVLSKACSLSLL